MLYKCQCGIGAHLPWLGHGVSGRMGKRRRREIGERGDRQPVARLGQAPVGKNLDGKKDIKLSQQSKRGRLNRIANIFRARKLNVHFASTAGRRYLVQKYFMMLKTVGETLNYREKLFRPSFVVFRITPETVRVAGLQHATVGKPTELTDLPGPARLHGKPPRHRARVDGRMPDAENDVVIISGHSTR